MPVDGTYGRLRAHNQRTKELRRKTLKRREDKLRLNRFKSVKREQPNSESDKINISESELKKIKKEVREQARKELRNEIFLSIAILLAIVLTIVSIIMI